jgi:hypothetical protein
MCRNSLTPDYLLFEEYECVYVCVLFLCASVHVCVCACVWEPSHTGLVVYYFFLQCCEILFSKNSSKIVSWKSIILGCSNLLFCISSIIYSIRRKYSAFTEYAQCMSRHHDTCVNVHHWLTNKDFNSSDGFRHKPWWITLYVFICINMAVCLPSKNIVGNDVTSHIFLSLILFEILKVSPW